MSAHRMDAVLFTDPGCPWGWSAWPWLSTLRWRYGDALRWRIVMIGLAETNERYVRAGYHPVRSVASGREFGARFGMPFGAAPRERICATGRACRAVVAARLVGGEDVAWAAVRALSLGWFCSDTLLDEDDAIAATLAGVAGLDVTAVMGALDAPEVEEAYQHDRAETRSAAGSPTEFQGKAADTDGAVRYTAPSVVFTRADGSATLEAGGFQHLDAYDVCIANLDAGMPRRGPAESAMEALRAFPHGLTTQEVAQLRATSLAAPDRPGAEAELAQLAFDGRVRRLAFGDDALWIAG